MSNKTFRAELDPREDGDAALLRSRLQGRDPPRGMLVSCTSSSLMSVKARETKSWRWFLLWTQRVRDDAQTGQPKTIRPALSLANIGAQPGFVVINAFLRTKALKRSPVPHEAELAMAVSAVIFHNFLSGILLSPTTTTEESDTASWMPMSVIKLTI